MEIELEIKLAGNEVELKLKGWRLFTTLVALALLAIGAPQFARSRSKATGEAPEEDD